MTNKHAPVDLDALGDATDGPWSWLIHDYSMASLCTTFEVDKYADMNPIMSVSPCKSCQERGAEQSKWLWGSCRTPNEANARLIAAAPAMAEEIRLLREALAECADACEGSYDATCHPGEGTSECDIAARKARALLPKSEGSA